VYLWGALHSVRENPGTTSTYHAFATWDPLTPEAEVTNFSSFWQWLTDVREAAHRTGRSFRAYCYNASAENAYLRKLGLGLGAMDQVMAFIQSEEWVDLLRTVDDQLVTGTGSGLKAIAPLAGYHWGVDDPGGGISMVQYDIAAALEDSPERERARQWLLTYNRGDVEATLAIRDWLEGVGSEVPSITTVDPLTLAGIAYAAGRS
jgi:predicted RecB family nuclease